MVRPDWLVACLLYAEGHLEIKAILFVIEYAVDDSKSSIMIHLTFFLMAPCAVNLHLLLYNQALPRLLRVDLRGGVPVAFAIVATLGLTKIVDSLP